MHVLTKAVAALTPALNDIDLRLDSQHSFRALKSTCPSVRNNQFIGGGEALSMYLTYLVIHEMVHFYLGKASLAAFTDPPEIYPINECVALDPLNLVHSPQSYQFYVASKRSRFHCPQLRL